MARADQSGRKILGTVLIVLSCFGGFGTLRSDAVRGQGDRVVREEPGTRLQQAALSTGMFLIGVWLFVHKSKEKPSGPDSTPDETTD